MKGRILFFILSLSFSLAGQQIGVWDDMYSYNRVNDMARMGRLHVCAAGMGLFTFDYDNREVKKFTKANGLSDINIKAIEYDDATGMLVIGYLNGNVDLFNGNRVYNIADILQSSSHTGHKEINEIIVRNSQAYLATGFGIVQIDLEKRLVRDTWIIGAGGASLEVYDLTFNETRGEVWASTADGLYKADIDDPLFYYGSWSKDPLFPGANDNYIESSGSRIWAVKDGATDTLYYLPLASDIWVKGPDQSIGQLHQLSYRNGFLYTSFDFHAQQRDSSGVFLEHVTGDYGGNHGFRPLFTTRDEAGRWFIGDADFGLVFVDNPSFVQKVKPSGPPTQNAFNLSFGTPGMFVATGSVNGVWAPMYLFNGIYIWDGADWEILNGSLTNNAHDIVQVLQDPMDPSRWFAATFGSGILEFRDGVLYQNWNTSNTNGVLNGTSGPNDLRSGGMAFDDKGNLWITSSLSSVSLARYNREGDWQGFSIGTFNGRAIKTIRIFSNGDFWLQGRNNGIYAVRINEQGTATKFITTGEGNGNLPSDYVNDFTEDKDGEIWIATGEGIAVLYAPGNVFQPGAHYDAQPVLFEENGVVQRLLGAEGVSCIAVDGANRKWFGTETGGVFLTSEDGVEEIFHFTTENSPLPSNRVNDIEIDAETGIVYIATDMGIVTYNGDATEGKETMDHVLVYPNPVRPGYEGPIAIRGLVADAQIKITDIAGNLVFETQSNGGQAIWMGRDLSGNRVSTGIYMAYITDDLGENTQVVKILLVNGPGQ